MDKKIVKVMTYNLWFREDLELIRRMNAIGDLIQHHSPDVIGFQVLNSNYSLFSFLFYMGIRYSYLELQEVTPDIYLLLKKSDWWQAYKCSLSHEEAMERPYYCMQV